MKDYGLFMCLSAAVGFIFGTAIGFQLGFLFGFNDAQEIEVITEQHYVTEIADGFVRTEQVKGSGEGTIYPVQLYALHGVTPEVGTMVEFGWTAQDYEDEVWERVYSLEGSDAK